MGKTWIVVAVVAAGACGWFGRRAFSDDPPAAPGGGSDMEKAMIELGTPGAMHKWLASQEGPWTVAMTAYGRDGKPEKTQASATMKMILDGRFQEQRFAGSIGGKAYEGIGLTGYDNLKKEFVLYWFDSMSTAPSISRGQRSEDGKTLTLSGTRDLPGMKMPFNQVWTVKSEKELGFAMTMTMQGQEMPVMETTYTRK